ncbi:MAG: cytidine deaminase [Bacteroidales bacterium]
MEERSLTVKYREYIEDVGLSEGERQLLNCARKAAKDGYAPYSNFRVGAAVRLDNGEIIIANNQENAALPSGMCAERVALNYAHSNYPNSSVDSIAISAFVDGAEKEEPIYPCGSCRQVMVESEKRSSNPIKVIAGGRGYTHVVEGIKNFLPFAFEEIE